MSTPTNKSTNKSGNRSLTNTSSLNLSGNIGSANSQLLNNKLSGPNSINAGSSRGSAADGGSNIYGQFSNRRSEPPAANSTGSGQSQQVQNTLLGPNSATSTQPSTGNSGSRGNGNKNASANKQNEESFLSNLFGPSSDEANAPSGNSANKNTKKNNNKSTNAGSTASKDEEPGFLENLFGGNENKSESANKANGNGNNSKKSETANEQPKNNSIINSAKSTVSEGIESIKSAASGLANQVSHRLEEVAEDAGADSGNLMMTLLKIVIALLVIIGVFFVARYLLGKYQDSVYSSPYLLEGSKNAKHALVVSQDPANPSYVPMPKSDGQDGIQFTYDFWIMIESFEYKTGEWKHVFHKGNASSYPNRAPGVWIHPNTNALRVYMNTQDNILEYVDIANVPIRKWIHMAIVLDDMNLDVYVNGYLKTRKLLTSVPKLNNGDFWCNMFGGFEGYLSHIRYYARAIGPNEIAENVKSGPGNSACIDTGQVPPYLDDDWWLS